MYSWKLVFNIKKQDCGNDFDTFKSFIVELEILTWY